MSIRSNYPIKSLLALLAAVNAISCATFYPTAANAQAVTVISNSSNARACYNAASRASLKLTATKDDLDSCNVAVDKEFLSRTDLARTHVNRGIVEVALEKFQDALADYNKALELVPRMPEAYISRGNLWYLAEKYQRAADEYTQAMQTDFNRPQIAYYNRALANERLANLPAAEADLREALKLDPEFRQARERLDHLTGKPAQ